MYCVESIAYMYKEQKCRICGCTEEHGCPGGCYWVEGDLCSQCAEKIEWKDCPKEGMSAFAKYELMQALKLGKNVIVLDPNGEYDFDLKK